ncbi:putative ribonuclease H-like domain-containing protein [Tanacetum coccineum]
MLEFCREKGIKQEFSNARTPQQNEVAERMNRTLIEAARTMLADSHLPTTFWAEAVNTACYTFNRVRVTKPQNKTPYELLFGHKPILSYIRPFGCHVTILNTLSPLGKFDGKSDEGFLVGYSVNSKAFRVYNLVTKRVEVNLHVNFLEEKPNVQGIGHRWMFDLDYLTDSMNYIPVSVQNQANPAGSKEVIDIDVQTNFEYDGQFEEQEKVFDAHASGEEQEEEISPNTLEAAKTLSKVASLKSRSIDKGRRYKRRKESTGKKVVSSLDFQEDNTGAEKINTAGEVNAASIEVNTASKVNTGSIELNTVIEQDSTAGENKGQREGKAPMLSEETPKKTKEQILQEEASLAEAIRLDSLQREEEAEQIHLDALLAQRIAEEEELTEQQKKRKAQVQFEAQHYTNEDWDLIRAKLEANAELSKSMLGSELQGEDFAKKMVDLVNQRKKFFAEERAKAKRNKPMTQSQLKTYMMNYLKNQGSWKLNQLRKLSFEEVKEEFDKLIKQIDSFAPISFEATKDSLKRFGEELQTKTPKRLKEDKDDEAKDDEPTKKLTKRRKQIARKGMHTSVDENISDDSDKVDEQEETNTGAKGLTSLEQTATGKGISNSFMASTMDMHLFGGQRTRLNCLSCKTNCAVVLLGDGMDVAGNLDMNQGTWPAVTCLLDADLVGATKYCDRHKQVGFKFKQFEVCSGFTEIVDFLRRSKLRPLYDATQHHNATIDSINIKTEESVRTATPIRLEDASDQGNKFATLKRRKVREDQAEQIVLLPLRTEQILPNVVRPVLRDHKPPVTTTSTAVNTGSTPSAQVNTGSTPSAQVNTGSTPSAELNTGETERVQRREGKAQMTEEDLQANVSKASRNPRRARASRASRQEEEAAKEALATEFDYIQARLNVIRDSLQKKIHRKKREQNSIEDRAKEVIRGEELRKESEAKKEAKSKEKKVTSGLTEK